jgi:hypothetical protein
MTYTPVPPACWIEPEPVEYEDFPDSPLTTESTLVLEADRRPDGAQAILGVPYATKAERTLHLQFVMPPEAAPWSTKTYPLVVFVQGSAAHRVCAGEREHSRRRARRPTNATLSCPMIHVDLRFETGFVRQINGSGCTP